ncbi:MarR family transcriptional regulator [Oscillatoria sp. FACHB-1407]|uniref:BRO family protein n=1 Tax=Oscillatoria sp. FACHB-1407 TaxID=2692847 RepID=UPI00168549DF|nr:BRO family protein [Oscillatoria sp. FACHB-1407]MBD2462278.1 MarR family transcriptional regulator [Oscillatoria sp. FACHB-1407]
MNAISPRYPQGVALFGAFENYEIRWNGNLDNPEWIAQDVAAVLGIKNVSDALANFDDDEKGYYSLAEGNIAITDALNRPQPFLTVTEPGLYRLVFTSRKPGAKAFRRWVFHEVLPSIRKTGGYATRYPSPIPTSSPDPVIDLLLNSDLTRAELRVLALLHQNQDGDLSDAKIATRLGIDVRTVKRVLTRLQDGGLVAVERRVEYRLLQNSTLSAVLRN